MRVVQVDAFAERACSGNPAAVCVLDEDAAESWMAAVAAEMNLSETAFVRRVGDGVWGLRWFTPTVEVDLCGHATLASAHVLWQDGHLPADGWIRFETRSGVLEARREDDGGIVLDFPAQPAEPAVSPPGLFKALGVTGAAAVARNGADWLVELDSAAAVREAKPDFGALRAVPGRGVIITAPADDGAHDFVSRFFAPNVGVDEDPVTGSAHCCLAPWWAERLGRDELRGYQASTRGGTVGVRVRGERVELVGKAVTVLVGELLF